MILRYTASALAAALLLTASATTNAATVGDAVNAAVGVGIGSALQVQTSPRQPVPAQRINAENDCRSQEEAYKAAYQRWLETKAITDSFLPYMARLNREIEKQQEKIRRAITSPDWEMKYLLQRLADLQKWASGNLSDSQRRQIEYQITQTQSRIDDKLYQLRVELAALEREHARYVDQWNSAMGKSNDAAAQLRAAEAALKNCLPRDMPTAEFEHRIEELNASVRPAPDPVLN